MDVSGATGSISHQHLWFSNPAHIQGIPFRNVNRQSTIFTAIDTFNRLSDDASTTLCSANAAINILTPLEMNLWFSMPFETVSAPIPVGRIAGISDSTFSSCSAKHTFKVLVEYRILNGCSAGKTFAGSSSSDRMSLRTLSCGGKSVKKSKIYSTVSDAGHLTLLHILLAQIFPPGRGADTDHRNASVPQLQRVRELELG